MKESNYDSNNYLKSYQWDEKCIKKNSINKYPEVVMDFNGNTSQELIKTIEWEMLDKKKFFPMSMLSSFTVRCFLYPLTLIRTRLQVQCRNNVYEGTLDAFSKILSNEGIQGLYRGFWVSTFQVVSGVCYVSTYEGMRHFLEKSNVSHAMIKSFIGGGSASIVGQTIIVPFDVISQHLMLIGQNDNLKPRIGPEYSYLSISLEGRTKSQVVLDVIKEIYIKDGLIGFYRGYTASLCTYVPSSASWWTFYHIFQEFYGTLFPSVVSLMFLQCISAMSSGCAACLITNPLDLIRTRVQVQRLSLTETIRNVWKVERSGIFTKGLTARMTSSIIYSLAIIFGYETVKRCSVYNEYKARIKW